MDKKITIALTGNANVGKSVLFNHLTGLNQTIGNWPGKTVERAEGTFLYKDWQLNMVDLPGVYSLSSYTQEEIVTRDYIIYEKPDVIVNVVDASNLERNLFLTIQLMEMALPTVLVVNQVDYAENRGITVDAVLIEKLTGMRTVTAVATKGIGAQETVEAVIEVYQAASKGKAFDYASKLDYGRDVRTSAESISNVLSKNCYSLLDVYNPFWLAIKLLEKDAGITDMLLKEENSREAVSRVNEAINELESKKRQPSFTVVSSARYAIASEITRSAALHKERKRLFGDFLDTIALHRIWGYLFMVGVLLAVFYLVFQTGQYVSSLLDSGLRLLKEPVYSLEIPPYARDLLWNGLIQGVFSVITIVLPYILPFYIILSIGENSGYLARIAFLTDSFMHRIGLHGKAMIPIMMGYGCNVPAVLGTRILESKKEITVASLLATLVPCSARTVIILGTVGVYMGPQYAILLYLFDLGIIYLSSIAVNKIMPGKTHDLIMELPGYRKPAFKPIAKQIWFRIKDFVYVAMPVVIIGSLVLEILKLTGVLKFFTAITDPVIIGWLGLPSLVGIVLVFGIMRKELTLIMLLQLYGTTLVTNILTPKQMLVFGVVVLFYFPCISTVVALDRAVGWRRAAVIVAFNIVLAIILGGLVNLIF